MWEMRLELGTRPGSRASLVSLGIVQALLDIVSELLAVSKS